MADPVQNPTSSSPAPAAGDASQGAEGKSKAQQRIDSLIKRSTEAESRTARLEAENAKLLDKVGELSLAVEKVLAGSKPAPVTQPANDLESAVTAAVGKVLGPLVEEAKAQKEVGTLRSQQEAAFERVIAGDPRYGDENSEEFKAFKAVFEGRSELNSSPDGPVLAAAIVDGILGKGQRGSRANDAAKSQASIFGAAGGQIPLDSNSDDMVKAVEARDKLLAKGKETGWARQELQDYITLQLATGGRKA